MLLPAYKPLLKQSRPVKKQISTWPVGKTAASQEDQIDIEEYAEAVTSYIAKCTEDVTVIKTFTAQGNRKPWMTTVVRSLLIARDAAFRVGLTALPLSQVCTLKRNQGCKRHLCRENPGTPLWHRKHLADVAGSPGADGLQVQTGGHRWWCFSSRQAQQLLCMLWSTKPDNQREGWSFSTIYHASPQNQRSRHMRDPNQGQPMESGRPW